MMIQSGYLHRVWVMLSIKINFASISVDPRRPLLFKQRNGNGSTGVG